MTVTVKLQHKDMEEADNRTTTTFRVPKNAVLKLDALTPANAMLKTQS